MITLFEDVFDDVDFDGHTNIKLLVEKNLFGANPSCFMATGVNKLAKNIIWHFMRREKKLIFFYETSVKNNTSNDVFKIMLDIERKFAEITATYSPFSNEERLKSDLTRDLNEDKFNIYVFVCNYSDIDHYVNVVTRTFEEKNKIIPKLIWGVL